MVRAILIITLAVFLGACAGPRVPRGALHASKSHDGHDHDPATQIHDHAAGPAIHDPHLAQHGHEGPGHVHDHGSHRLLRNNLAAGWGDPIAHLHRSPGGTPFVHAFLTEPAFLGRDVFFDVSLADGETEIEAEVEWALTRRLGFIAALPYVDGDESGVGDVELGLRALLIEMPDLLLSASTVLVLPTGDDARELGLGEAALGAHVHTWWDLGGWTALQTQTGIEVLADSGDAELVWSFSLSRSFCVCPLFGHPPGVDAHRGHGPHAFSVLAEIAGATGLSGDESGDTEGEWLVGATYPLSDQIEIRGAFARSFEGEERWLLGFIAHF